jgi:hypothetical protein
VKKKSVRQLASDADSCLAIQLFSFIANQNGSCLAVSHRVAQPVRQSVISVRQPAILVCYTSHQHFSLPAISLLPLCFLQSVFPPPPPLAPGPFTWADCRKSLSAPVQFSPFPQSASIDVHSLHFNSPSPHIRPT